MIEKPQSFETSWTEAEQAAFNALVAATATTEGRDAFLGANPNIVNAWYMAGLPLDVGESVLLSQDVPSMCVPAVVECVYQRRADCQKWLMRIIAGLPLRDSGNIALFRIRKVGEVAGGAVVIREGEPALAVYSLKVECDLVFATGGKSNIAGA